MRNSISTTLYKNISHIKSEDFWQARIFPAEEYDTIWPHFLNELIQLRDGYYLSISNALAIYRGVKLNKFYVDFVSVAWPILCLFVLFVCVLLSFCVYFVYDSYSK